MAKLNSEDRTKIIIAVISAVAVILAAVIGAAWSDIRSWFSQGNELAKLGGVWRGELTLYTGVKLDMTVTFEGNCSLNEVCGTVLMETPNANYCKADVTIVSLEDNRYMIEPSNLSASCLQNAEYRYFEYLDKNTLVYEVGEAGKVFSRGTLKRVH